MRIVGIDLGTTHTVVAWADAARPEAPRVFEVPQLVTRTEIAARAMLPSCLFAPTASDVVEDHWNDAPWIAGELAQRRGAEVPGRFVASAKSWLCHPSVDRTAAILPWGGDDDAPRISPVDASARYLAHVRSAWDAAFPDAPLASQEIVLTVPASFDEVARELTLDAARRAKLPNVRLLEEPQAAFYDVMQRVGRKQIEPGLVLVCDVGGGTTDLSLIRVGADDVERIAVGNHLLLGGDNMDLALALACEARMTPSAKLDAARFGQLVGACRGAKERLLAGDDAPDEVTVSVLGSGAKLVGGALSTKLARAEVESVVLDGFFPLAPRDAKPQRARGALVAFGLPYEKDVAITRHVAWFFARHAPSGETPSAVLLNGGVFRARRIADRLVAALEAWGGPKVRVLPHDEPDLGVARGAVAYGLALRGHGARIEGGAARGYYVGLGGSGDARTAVCVVPRGAKEGAMNVAQGRTFALAIGRAVRFDLFASNDARIDLPGDVVTIDDESFDALPPFAVAFAVPSDGGAAPKPRASAPPSEEIKVALEGELTPIGTLDLACVEIGREPPRRFRLAFQLRAASDAPQSIAPPLSRARPSSLPPGSIGGRRLDEARDAIDRAFGKPREGATGREAKDLVRELERILGERATWSMDVARSLFDTLSPMRGARRRTADHERAFWMLAGYCVRPGIGDPLDAARVASMVPMFADRLAFPDEARGWQQFWIAWRRAAAGLDEAAQASIRDTVDPLLAPPEAGLKKSKKLKAAALDDLLDMASSLERLPPQRRADLGGWILERTYTDHDPRLYAALGRIGARVPTYASLHHVVAPAVVERWLDHLLREKWDQIPTVARAATELGRVTGDRARDLGERVRRDVDRRLAAHAPHDARAKEWARAVRELVAIEESDRAAFFGEGLPAGLRLAE